MSTIPHTPEVSEFIDLLMDVCRRNHRHATICVLMAPDALPLVVLVDQPCTDKAFHSELSDAASTCDMHRVRSMPKLGSWEYHYTPLPSLEQLLSNA